MAQSIGMGIEGLPARPRLRPGVFWCRRGDGLLQVGISPDRGAIAHDTESVRRLLSGLGTGQTLPSDLDRAAIRLCRDLVEAHLIVSAADLVDLLGRAASAAQRESMLAVVAADGAQAPMVWASRAAHRVRVSHDHLPRSADRLRSMLIDGGVDAVTEDPPGAPPPDLELHLALGEVDRDRSDAWLQDDRAHLLLTTCEGQIRVGPFVVPGQTPCLRCLDAHEADIDPRRPLVIQQYAVSSPREVEHPAPAAPDLLDLALAWVARDALSWCEGRTPRTWGATVAVTPDLVLARTRWSVHAACGCGWGLTAPAGRTA